MLPRVAIALMVCAVVGGATVSCTRQRADERPASAAFSDFVNDIHQGKVVEVEVDERQREFRYQLLLPDGGTQSRVAVGPAVTEELLSTLKPLDPKAVPPRVRVVH